MRLVYHQQRAVFGGKRAQACVKAALRYLMLSSAFLNWAKAGAANANATIMVAK